jgi:hypothetical protein
VIPLHTNAKQYKAVHQMINVRVDGVVILLLVQKIAKQKVQYFHLEENLGFVILQKDLLVYQIKTLTLKLAKN